MELRVYVLIEEKDADGSPSYGFARVGTGGEVCEYPCLNERKESVEELVLLLNELEPDPVHLDDIVDDYLTDLDI